MNLCRIELMTGIEKDMNKHTRHMLKSIFSQFDLNALAETLGIRADEIGRDRLIDCLSGISLTKEHYAALYEELSPDFQLFLHYLSANQCAVKIEEAARFLEGWDVIKKQGYLSLKGVSNRLAFLQFKRNLAVKGLALIVENHSNSSSASTFRRFSFRLPEHYSDFLPPLPVEGEKMREAGEKKSFDDFVKVILFSFLGYEETEDKTVKKMISHIFWHNRRIMYWDYSRIRSAGDLPAHIFSAWKKDRAYKNIDIAANLFYLLKWIPPDEWISLPNLIEFSGRFTCFPEPDKIRKTVGTLCSEAFEAGLLERIDTGSEFYYRLNRQGFPFADPCADGREKPPGIHVEEDGSLRIDRNVTPVHL